ncbi:MAG: hypothetical protein OD815_000119 [Candidatus Alkanophagales archaeon MCA70_species_2]|nr:hypothetical protein [Candidatus Alkanophaga liquidiphilum]
MRENQTKVGLKYDGAVLRVLNQLVRKSDQGGIEIIIYNFHFCHHLSERKSDQGGIEINMKRIGTFGAVGENQTKVGLKLSLSIHTTIPFH